MPLLGERVIDAVRAVLPGRALAAVALATGGAGAPAPPPGGWDCVAESLSAAVGAEVVARPAAALAALGEGTASDGEGGDVLYVVADVPVMAASVVDGDLVIGADGIAGTVGTLRFVPPGHAGVSGLRSLDDVVAEVLAHTLDRRRHREAGRHLGAAIAVLGAVLAPRTVVIAARPPLGADYLAGVREVVYSRMPPSRTLGMDVRLAALDPDVAAGLGGSSLLRRMHPSPDCAEGAYSAQ